LRRRGLGVGTDRAAGQKSCEDNGFQHVSAPS
jgi:hypothetical protein